MQKYDPMLDPDPEQWELLDEAERVDLVIGYHQETGIEIPNSDSHAVLHVAVENQIALGAETPVEAAFRRLLDEDLDRHDAIHAIASVLINYMFELMHGEDGAQGNEAYYAEIEKLTAAKWSRGEYSEEADG